MNEYRYTTDDRDLPIDEQRELVLFKDVNGHLSVDVVGVGHPSLDPIVVSKNNPQYHEVYVVLDSTHRSLHALAQGVSFEGYQELKEELQAWQNEFGSAGRTQFPEFTPAAHGSNCVQIASEHSSLNSLQILLGGNQDWYVSKVCSGNKELRGVRLCTSGGASSRSPELVTGVAEIYRILLSPFELDKQSPSYPVIQQEVLSFRENHPEHEYRFGFIQAKELDF